MSIRSLIDTRVLIVGAGVSGLSVARFLHRHGVGFDVVDERGVPTDLAALAEHVHERLDASLVTRFDTIVLSPGVPRAHPALGALDEADGRRIIGDIELFAAAARAPVVAVTGSNGKSTVVAWLSAVLGRLGIEALACGNIGRPLGRPALDSLSGADGSDSPNAPECHVLELSSYQLESTFSLVPHVAVVLNVSEDHLDRYASLAHYAAVKRRVHNGAARLLVNADDPATAPTVASPTDALIDALPTADVTPPMVRFSLGERDSLPGGEGDVLWHRSWRDGSVWLCRDGEALLRQSALGVPGDHNAANALAVFALIECLEGRLHGLAPGAARGEAVRDAVLAFHGLPHRTELIDERFGVRWYNDSKGTNVDACAKAIEAMPGPVVLIAGGLAKEADFTPLRPALQRHVRAAVLIGRDRERLYRAFDGATALHRADTLEEAVSLADGLALSGDAVLLSPACASFDMFRDFEARGERFGACVRALPGDGHAVAGGRMSA